MILRIAKIACLVAAFLVVAVMSAYFTMTFIIRSEDTVIVPDLSGKGVVYALEILTDLGLNTKSKGSEYSTRIPKNHIIFQEPEPGGEIKKGRDVRIVLSKGVRTVLMPNLAGLTIQRSRIALEQNGLCRGNLSRTYSETFGKDKVITHFPVPGVMTEQGACVNLLVSLGKRPEAYKMPDLDELTLDEAIALIESRHMRVGEITSAFRADRPENTVLTQNPPAGFRVIEGSVVHFALNRKPDKEGEKLGRGAPGMGLFRYRMSSGFLKRRIRVQLDRFGASGDIFDELVKPGEEIWLLIPRSGDTRVSLFEDDKLIKHEVF